MLKCSCYNCPNRQIGCHKFCSDYRKYRREREALQAETKKSEESSKGYIETFFKNNFKRK